MEEEIQKSLETFKTVFFGPDGTLYPDPREREPYVRTGINNFGIVLGNNVFQPDIVRDGDRFYLRITNGRYNDKLPIYTQIKPRGAKDFKDKSKIDITDMSQEEIMEIVSEMLHMSNEELMEAYGINSIGSIPKNISLIVCDIINEYVEQQKQHINSQTYLVEGEIEIETDQFKIRLEDISNLNNSKNPIDTGKIEIRDCKTGEILDCFSYKILNPKLYNERRLSQSEILSKLEMEIDEPENVTTELGKKVLEQIKSRFVERNIDGTQQEQLPEMKNEQPTYSKEPGFKQVVNFCKNHPGIELNEFLMVYLSHFKNDFTYDKMIEVAKKAEKTLIDEISNAYANQTLEEANRSTIGTWEISDLPDKSEHHLTPEEIVERREQLINFLVEHQDLNINDFLMAYLSRYSYDFTYGEMETVAEKAKINLDDEISNAYANQTLEEAKSRTIDTWPVIYDKLGGTIDPKRAAGSFAKMDGLHGVIHGLPEETTEVTHDSEGKGDYGN